MLKLCIFDMDGTAVNSLRSIAYFANQTLVRNGFAPYPDDAYKTMVGNGAAKLVRRMIDGRGGNDAQYRAVLAEYNLTYDSNPLFRAAAYDGIVDVMDALRTKGVAIAILSNKPHTTTCQIAQGLFGDRVDACFGGRDGVPLKPAPDAVNALMAQFDASPAECLYIGDTATDMETAANAGVFSIGAEWGFRSVDELKNAGAGALAAQPSDILAIATEKFGI